APRTHNAAARQGPKNVLPTLLSSSGPLSVSASPPRSVVLLPDTESPDPPTAAEETPVAVLPLPPPIDETVPSAVLVSPPPTASKIAPMRLAHSMRWGLAPVPVVSPQPPRLPPPNSEASLASPPLPDETAPLAKLFSPPATDDDGPYRMVLRSAASPRARAS